MAYVHSKYEVVMIPVLQGGASVGGQQSPSGKDYSGVQLGITGVQAWWGPGFMPHIIKGAAVIHHQVAAVSPRTAVGFDADITTPGTPTRMFTIRTPSVASTNRAYYFRPTRHIEIPPGALVQARVTAAATALSKGHIVLYVEPRWEEPVNVTTMATQVGAS